MRGYQTNLPGWPPRAAPNGSIKPLLEAQESSTKVLSTPPPEKQVIRANTDQTDCRISQLKLCGFGSGLYSKFPIPENNKIITK